MQQKKFLSSLIIAASALIAFGIVHAQARPNASITLQKDNLTGFFKLNIRDPEGIREFSLQPEGKSSYGGGVRCPQTFSNDNVIFSNEDFSPPMKAFVIDCSDNQTDFEISPPDDKGFVRAKVVGPLPPPPPPPPPPAPVPAAPTPPPPPPQKSLVDVGYPVKELGNCNNQEACLSYCDDDAHINECLAFAKKHGLLSEDEVKKADKFVELGSKGPGGCTSRKSCETYCSNISRMDECIEWGEKNGFISGKELEEAKKVQTAVKGGAKLPGGCTSKQSCETYCSSGKNIDECLVFAEKAGFIPKEEIEQAKKFAEFMKRGETPGGCRSKDQCEAYCFEGDHMEECIAFADKAGMISAEEKEMIKKTGGKGPGGCKGKVQCEAYCNTPEHQEACFKWAQENGLMKEEDLARMREGMGRFREEFKKMPPEAAECLKATVGEEVLNKMLKGEPVFARDLGEKMQACFAKMLESFGGGFGGPGGPGGFPGGPGGPGGFPGGGPGGPGGFSGPGGCSNPEECFKYCTEHQDECKEFAPPGGGPSGPGDHGGFPGGAPGGFPGGGIPSGADFVGPGGCRTPDQCIRYCKEPGHEKECNEFKTPAGTPRAPGRGPGGQSGGPGGCATVEECREYCNANRQVCDDFISEDVPHEGKCQAGFQIERDALGYKYCNPLSCPEGQEFGADVFGRRYCAPVGLKGGAPGGFPGGAPGGFPGGAPSGGFPSQFEGGIPQQFQQQFQQQLQQQLPGTQIPGVPSAPLSPTPPPQSSATVSGICLVWSGKTAFPLFFSPDSGSGYAKIAKPGVNDISKLREVCTRADYDNLLRQYCANNSDNAQEQVATFFSQGALQSNGGGPFGNDYRSCSSIYGSPNQQQLPSGFEDPAKVCAGKGGVWDGKTCTYPTSPSGFNVQSGAADSLRALFGIFGF